MLSRDADACFWIGRYVERAEATARMVDVHYHAALETPLPWLPTGRDTADTFSPIKWQSILDISGAEADYQARYQTESDRDIIHYFAFDTLNPNSILSVWRAARENARAIREQIASEMWESLNASYLQLQEWEVDRVLAGSPHTFFQMVKNASHLFQGILNRTMLMGETRDWLDAGRFLERAGQTARLLDVKYHDLLPVYSFSQSQGAGQQIQTQGSRNGGGLQPFGVGGPLDTHGWIAVLKSVSAFEMYRKTHHDGITPANVVGFLVLNPQFPASVRHGIGRVEGCLHRIGGRGADATSDPERLIGRLMADLIYARPEEIIRQGLHEFLSDVLERCDDIGQAITRTYLAY